jgi:alcohol dehydrogenase YqhD (iron-dependent ADH family)
LAKELFRKRAIPSFPITAGKFFSLPVAEALKNRYIRTGDGFPEKRGIAFVQAKGVQPNPVLSRVKEAIETAEAESVAVVLALVAAALPGLRPRFSGAITHAGQAGADSTPHALERGISTFYSEISHGTGLGVIYPGWIEYCVDANSAHFAHMAKND